MYKTDRQLKAILVSDISGFTELAGSNEKSAVKIIEKQREIINSLIQSYNAKLHKEIGDGLLFSFTSVSEAIEFAIKFQKLSKEVEKLNLRIGIHEGEVVVINNDVIGDDVNIAFRIESYAPVGGVAISEKVNDNISSLPEYQTQLLGMPDLKGVSKNIKIYFISSHNLPSPKKSIVNKSKYNFYILGIIIFVFSMVNIIYPILDNENLHVSKLEFNSDSVNNYINHNLEILTQFEKIDNLLSLNNLEDNLRAYNIIDELIVEDNTISDYHSYKGKILYQRYVLSGNNKFRDSCLLSLSKAVDITNSNNNILINTLLLLAKIEFENNNIDKAYSYSRAALRLNKHYPGVREIFKKINRRRLT